MKRQLPFAEDVSSDLSALAYTHEVQERAEKIFDFYTREQALDKIREELAELEEAIARGSGIEEELGDLFFTMVNLACRLGLNAEQTSRLSAEKFIRRVRWVQKQLTQNQTLEDLSLQEWEALWIAAKRYEKEKAHTRLQCAEN